METRTLTIHYRHCLLEELEALDRELAECARRATLTSYAPYSHFSVGAAVRLSSGEIISGSNQENAAFGAGTCAERCALFHAHAAHPEEVVTTIAVAARGTDGEFTASPVSPCGICRQALLEARTRAHAPIRVLLCGREEVFVLNDVHDLLPFAFEEIV